MWCIYSIVQPLPLSYSKTFSRPKKEIPSPLTSHALTLGNTSLSSCLSVSAYPRLSCKRNHILCGLCVWLLSLSIMSQGSSMLQCVSVFHFFLQLNDIPLYYYSILSSFTHQLTASWKVSCSAPERLRNHRVETGTTGRRNGISSYCLSRRVRAKVVGGVCSLYKREIAFDTGAAEVKERLGKQDAHWVRNHMARVQTPALPLAVSGRLFEPLCTFTSLSVNQRTKNYLSTEIGLNELKHQSSYTHYKHYTIMSIMGLFNITILFLPAVLFYLSFMKQSQKVRSELTT